MPASQGWAFHPGPNTKGRSAVSSGYVTLSSPLRFTEHACTRARTEGPSGRRAEEEAAREGRREGGNLQTG